MIELCLVGPKGSQGAGSAMEMDGPLMGGSPIHVRNVGHK